MSKNVLISISDKSNLKRVLINLKKYKFNIISSGGTYREIKRLGFKCHEVSDFTGFAEILGGRVKTLHPKIHAGILFKRKDSNHVSQMKRNNFENIDMVIVNFYPFEKTLQTINDHKKIIEQIDIGGPALVRAAAKNFNDVVVVTKIDQYDELIYELKKNRGKTSLEFRKKQSARAFEETSIYDTLISEYMNKKKDFLLPEKKIILTKKIQSLRYGENPHQKAGIYSIDNNSKLKQLNGKELSFNNFNDMLSALSISNSLPKNQGCVIVKHSVPCGVSANSDKVKSFDEALACDPTSAFGGIVSFNFKINKNLANNLKKKFLEVIVCKGIEKNALKILKKKINLRIIEAKDYIIPKSHHFIYNEGFLLFQTPDKKVFSKNNFRVVSKKKPDHKTFKSLIFAFNVCRFVKSNAIVLAKNSRTIGIGSGQTSRLDSCQIAVNKMNKFNHSSKDEKIVAASDAFFPFVDGIETLVGSGVQAIIQPSGSIRDKEIIRFADKTGTVLVFSKTRHFKH